MSILFYHFLIRVQDLFDFSSEINQFLYTYIHISIKNILGCLSHIYAMPYLTYEPDLILDGHSCQNQTINHFPGWEPLKQTLYHSFDPEAENGGGHSHINEHHFCNGTEGISSL